MKAIFKTQFFIFLLYCLIFVFYFFPILIHLNSRVYGIIGDNFWWFLWGWWSKNHNALGFSDITTNPLFGIGGFPHLFWNSTHPLSWGISSELLRFLPTNFAYNLIMVSTFPLAGFFGYKLFYYFTKNRFLSFCFGLVYSFSPYHIFSSQRHTELSAIWLIPMAFLAFIKALDIPSRKNSILAGIALAVTMLSSIYWGVYVGVMLGCYLVAKCLTSFVNIVVNRVGPSGRSDPVRNPVRNDGINKYTKVLLLISFSFLLFTLPFLFPYIKANYLTKTDMTRGWVYQNQSVVKRGVDDFLRYSIMPYHFFIPPAGNPITGELSKSIVLTIKENWNYFLAQNYVFSEHGGDFLGWLNSGVFVLSLIYCLKTINFPSTSLKAGEFRILVFGLTALLVYIFSMPPYFTLGGRTIYTPAYLIYLAFPMLRTLSRMGVLIFLNVLLVNLFFAKLLFKKFENRNFKLLGASGLGFKILTVSFTAITLVEFFMPLKYLDDSNPPEEFAYLGKKNQTVSVDYTSDKGQNYKYTGPAFAAVYPWGYDIYVFYQKYFNKGFINPLFANNPALDFDAIKFSYEIDSKGGLKKAYDLGVRYIILNKGDEDYIARKSRGEKPDEFFAQNSSEVKEFDKHIIYELKETL